MRPVSPAELLRDSTSLLKDDPSIAATIGAPPVRGSSLYRRTKGVIGKLERLTPPLGSPQLDPFGPLLFHYAAIRRGAGTGARSLLDLCDRSNPHDPCLLALNAMDLIVRSITPVPSRQIEFEGLHSGEEGGSKPLAPLRQFSGDVIGYDANVDDVNKGQELLLKTAERTRESDIRRSLLMACYRFVASHLRGVRHHFFPEFAGTVFRFLFTPADPMIYRYTHSAVREA